MSVANTLYAQESLRIAKEGSYMNDGVKISIRDELNNSVNKTVPHIKEKDDLKGVQKLREPFDKTCKIELIRSDTISTLIDKTKGTKERWCALNFASARNPGGGFKTGASAQEESLCYRSLLYESLRKQEQVYSYSRQHDNGGLYSTWSIYTPDMIVYRKGDGTYLLLPILCSFITCPAPNRSRYRGKNSDVLQALEDRCEYVLKTAIYHNETNLVLGAFGCGVFENDPSEVAKTWRRLLLPKGYGRYFKNIVFAVIDSRSSTNYKYFYNVWLDQLRK